MPLGCQTHLDLKWRWHWHIVHKFLDIFPVLNWTQFLDSFLIQGRIRVQKSLLHLILDSIKTLFGKYFDSVLTVFWDLNVLNKIHEIGKMNFLSLINPDLPPNLVTVHLQILPYRQECKISQWKETMISYISLFIYLQIRQE